MSLWFPLRGTCGMGLSGGADEFVDARWWTPREIRAAAPETLDPHYTRFADKLGI